MNKLVKIMICSLIICQVKREKNLVDTFPTTNASLSSHFAGYWGGKNKDCQENRKMEIIYQWNAC